MLYDLLIMFRESDKFGSDFALNKIDYLAHGLISLCNKVQFVP